MPRRALTVLAFAVAVLAAAPAAATAKHDRGQQLRADAPFWMESQEIRERIDAAGARGLTIGEIEALVRLGLAGAEHADDPVADPCPTLEPGTKPNSVHTNACMTYPSGCTANFIYQKGTAPFSGWSDGRNHFIGTAGHCVERKGEPVYMDNGAGAVIRVGETWKSIDAGIGKDQALIRIDPGLAIDPRMPAIGGPRGLYAGCEPGQPISWWGHGYGVAVGQGNVGNGIATGWWDKPFGWDGDALPGDSGSGVVLDGSLMAAGDLTHLVIDSDYLPAVNAGTRQTEILDWAGKDINLVNEDGTLTTGPRKTDCGKPGD